MFKNREEFEEALSKSVKGMEEALNKAAPNIGSGGNDAAGKTPARRAWAKHAKKLEGEVDRLEGLSENKPDTHPIHMTLKRAQSELNDHYDAHPDNS